MRIRILPPLVFVLGAVSAIAQTAPGVNPATNPLLALVGQPFSQTFTCSGCPGGTQTWTMTGTLPSGLSFNAATATISGTATTPQQSTSVLIAVFINATGIARRSYTVNTDTPLVFVTPTPLAPATAGVAMSRTMSVNEGGISDSGSTNLPTNMSLQFNGTPTATLSGTFPAVTQPTTYSFTLFASYQSPFSNQFQQQTYSITVNPAPALTASFGPGLVGTAYSGSLAASLGTPPYTYSVTGSLPPGLQLNSATGAVTGTPTTAGQFRVTGSVKDANGATATAPAVINVATPLSITTTALPAPVLGQPYSFALAAAGGVPPYTWSVSAGSLPTGLTLVPGGTVSGSATAPGTFNFTLTVRDTSGQTATAQFSLVVASTLTITTSQLPEATVGLAYSFPLAASGGTPAYTWSLSSGTLPAGITLSSAGVLSGTPTAAGSLPITIAVRDSQGQTATANFILSVKPALSITTTSLPAASVGTAYSTTITAAGGTQPYTFSVPAGSLPAGLTLAPGGALAGTPTAAGSFPLTITVQDAQNQTATAKLTLTVTAGLTITTTSLPSGIVGTAYSATVAASGGAQPYTFSVSTGSLPAGLTLAAAGGLTGTPTAAGSFPITITVKDAQGQTASAKFTLAVAAGLSITTASLPAGTVGSAYSASIAAAGGFPPYTFTLSSGSLPAGLTLASGGAISGTPTAAANASFRVRVTDSQQFTVDAPFTLQVTTRPAPTISTQSLPNGVVGTAYSATITAQGSSALNWSVVTGSLPGGLALDAATGVVSGTPTAAGTFAFTVQAADSGTPPLSARHDFSVVIALPALPSVSVTQVQNNAAPSSQPTFGVALAQPFPVDLAGTATITFQPDSGPPDPDVKFANGQASVNFTIPATQVAAVPGAGETLAFSAGTTAGVITITVVLRSGGQVLSPNPAVTRTIRVAPAAPSITSLKINQTASGFELVAIGFSNTREVSGATVKFTGNGLTQTDFPVPVSSLFQQWFSDPRSAQFGTQFQFTVPFTFSLGAIGSLTSVQLVLTNGVGSVTSNSVNF